MTTAAVVHSTFCIERSYPQPPSRVFWALSNEASAREWRAEDEGCEVLEFTVDFRVGGGEVCRFKYGEGPEIRLDAQFHDIVPNQRMVYSYRMGAGPSPFSASLTTIELTADGDGTHLRYTEQGAYLDGVDSTEGRESGCRGLLEKLGAYLQAHQGG